MSHSPLEKLPGSTSLSGLVIAQGVSAPTSRKVNLTAVLDPGVNDDSSAGYGVGSLWVNTVLDKVFWMADASVGAAVWKEAGGGASGTSTRETVTVANSFSAGNAIRKNGTGWAKAQADSSVNAEVIGVVESASGSDFTIVYSGKITLTSHGFTVGDVLFLSPSTSGLLTVTEPSTATQISKPVAIVLDINNLIIINMRGTLITSASNTFDSIAPPTTKGDLIVRNLTTNVRQPAGTDGMFLQYDSSQSTGVKASKVDLSSTTNVTSTLPIGNGGLGLSSLGSALQQIQVNSGGTALEFFTPTPIPPGVIFEWGGTSAPSGYLLCDGSAISRTTYAALFANIGTNYGVGDGSTTFNVPDYRGRVGVGTGTGSGLTPRSIGATGGEETHAQSTAEMPAHTHTGDVWASGAVTSKFGSGSNSGSGTAVATSSTGSGTAFNVMNPFLVATKIIKT